MICTPNLGHSTPQTWRWLQPWLDEGPVRAPLHPPYEPTHTSLRGRRTDLFQHLCRLPGQHPLRCCTDLPLRSFDGRNRLQKRVLQTHHHGCALEGPWDVVFQRLAFERESQRKFLDFLPLLLVSLAAAAELFRVFLRRIPRIPIDFYGFLLISMVFYGFLRISTDFYGFREPKNTHKSMCFSVVFVKILYVVLTLSCFSLWFSWFLRKPFMRFYLGAFSFPDLFNFQEKTHI